MPTITGRLNSPTFNGRVRFTPDVSFVDTSTNPATLISLPITGNISNGSFSVVVPQSQRIVGQSNILTEGVTYKIELLEEKSTARYYFFDGSIYDGLVHQHTDTYWYTGSVHMPESVRLDRIGKVDYILISEPTHAIVPDTNASVDFSSLINTPIFSSNQDIGVWRIADILTLVPSYRDRISSKFDYRGNYSVSDTYSYNQVVSYGGNSYVWINSASLAGQTPPVTSNQYWLLLAQKGETGAGTTATIVGWNPIAWSGSNQASARSDVKDAIASIPNPDLSNYLTVSEGASRSNPSFTGSVKRSAMGFPIASAEKGTEIPTIGYVESLVQSAGLGALPSPLIFGRLPSTLSIGQDNVRTISWTEIIDIGGLMDNGIITIANAAGYLFYVSLEFSISTNYQSNSGQQRARAIARLSNRTNTTFSVGDFFNHNAVWCNNTTFFFKQQGLRFEPNLSAGTKLAIEAVTSRDGTEPSLFNASSCGGSAANNFFAMWRVS